MKVILTFTLILFLTAGTVLAAAIDGTWVSERELVRGVRKEIETQLFELKVKDKIINGTVATLSGEKVLRKVDIKDGRADGKKFSFIAVYPTPFGEVKISFEGEVDGKMLKGTTGPAGGAKHPFEAKRK